MLKFKVFGLALLFGAGSLIAQENEFNPKGKPVAKVFTNFHYGLGEDNDDYGFELTRSYLGYESTLTKNLFGKVIFDVGFPGEGKYDKVAFLKNAQITYKENGLRVDLGVISTTQFKQQEKFWGYRYLLKSFQDEYKFGSSADLGVSVGYKFSDVISADVIMVNGKGYKNITPENTIKGGFGLTLNPVKQVTLRAYAESFKPNTEENEELENQNTIAFFVGYKNDKFSLGGEYNMQSNHKNVKDEDLTGISVYSTYKMADKFKVFGRYDNLTSKDDWNASKDGNMYVMGFEYHPNKYFKIAPNYRALDSNAEGASLESSIYMSVEFKF